MCRGTRAGGARRSARPTAYWAAGPHPCTWTTAASRQPCRGSSRHRSLHPRRAPRCPSPRWPRCLRAAAACCSAPTVAPTSCPWTHR
jgi:hypothetical protein